MIISHLLKDVADLSRRNIPSSRYNIEPVPQEMPLWTDDGSAREGVFESRH